MHSRGAGHRDMGQGGRGPWPHTADPGPGTGQESRSTGGRGRLGLAGTAWYAITCILAVLTLTASGFSYFVVRDVASIGSSHAIASGPSVGAQNILLMGLESRRDWNGNILPNSILAKLHAGNAQAVANGEGGNDTNTLILIHIFAGGKKAVGFSIPRDDWADFAGTVGPQQTGKIDQAYGVSMYYQQANLRQQNPGMGQDRLAFLGNEAGRRAAVATVEQLTGVHVDHFAEVNLDGFYELARVFGGVEVCLNHNVYDPKSGAHFHQGYQHLDPAQSLSFVRQRDGLTNGDLDRTHRQQAFIDSVMYQLRTEGALSDLTKVPALLSVAKQYVITDAGLEPARLRGRGARPDQPEPRLPHAADQGVRDHRRPGRERGRRAVHQAHRARPVLPAAGAQTASPHPAAPPISKAAASRTTVGRAQRRQHGRAGRAGIGRAGQAGLPGRPGGEHGRPGHHGGLYGPGAAASAAVLARMFGVTATPAPRCPPRHVEILLGASAVFPPRWPQLPRVAVAIIPTTGPQGGAVRRQGRHPLR